MHFLNFCLAFQKENWSQAAGEKREIKQFFGDFYLLGHAHV